MLVHGRIRLEIFLLRGNKRHICVINKSQNQQQVSVQTSFINTFLSLSLFLFLSRKNITSHLNVFKSLGGCAYAPPSRTEKSIYPSFPKYQNTSREKERRRKKNIVRHRTFSSRTSIKFSRKRKKKKKEITAYISISHLQTLFITTTVIPG